MVSKKIVRNNSSEIKKFTKKSKKNFIDFLKTRKRTLMIVVAVSLLLSLLYYFKSLFIVVLVNNQPITRLQLVQELEKQSGKKTLTSLVTKTLIYQEAKKQKISITETEINEEIKNLKDQFTKQGQNFDELLKNQGMTESDLKNEVEIQKIIEAILGKDLKITDEEINNFLAQNKDYLPKDKSQEELKIDAKKQLEQQKISEKVQEWLDSLNKNAKIQYYLNFD